MTAKKILVLFSGGLDSTVALASAVVGYGADAVHALGIFYGQRHSIELEAADAICEHLGVSFEVVDVPSVLEGTSSLVTPGAPDQAHSDSATGTSDAFVPARNILFLSVAANRAALCGADIVYVGANAEDLDGFPDCRPAFFTHATKCLQLALDNEGFMVHPPLLQFDKKAIIETAQRIQDHGVDVMGALSLSHTCYRGSCPPCGECSACVLRARAFARVGIADPLVERTSKDSVDAD